MKNNSVLILKSVTDNTYAISHKDGNINKNLDLSAVSVLINTFDYITVDFTSHIKHYTKDSKYEIIGISDDSDKKALTIFNTVLVELTYERFKQAHNKNLITYNQSLKKIAKANAIPNGYISADEYIQPGRNGYGKSVQTINRFCREGKFEYCTKKGRNWYIDSNSPLPIDKRSLGNHRKK